MKRKLFLIASLFIPVIFYAQITVDETNFVSIGDSVFNSADTSNPSIVLGSAGANQVWDFSTLVSERDDTLLVVDPMNTPLGTLGNSNLAVVDGSNVSYLEKSIGALIRIQTWAIPYLGYTLTLTDPRETFTFPITYNSQVTDNYSGTLELPNVTTPQFSHNDSVRVRLTGVVTTTVDAWGTLKLPLGDFKVLRQVSKDVVTANIDVKAFGFWNNNAQTIQDSVLVHQFLTDSNIAKYPITAISLNPANSNIQEVSWINRSSSLTSSIDRIINQNEFNIYPSPATDDINIYTKDEIKTYRIYDVMGNLVSENRFSNRINVSTLKKGVYFLQLEGKGKLGTKKFIKL